ncbi:unnamed protein product [Hymenolepis diminuta]|uniref:PAP2_C domain-containing protein n=1 Tax=Hymenolepis diminuta TaxID=6216 RepID=A0A0R3SIH5_HYMDI|nr:unnamed protein product [Hymenolepis diminuta]
MIAAEMATQIPDSPEYSTYFSKSPTMTALEWAVIRCVAVCFNQFALHFRWFLLLVAQLYELLVCFWLQMLAISSAVILKHNAHYHADVFAFITLPESPRDMPIGPSEDLPRSFPCAAYLEL